MKHFFFFILSLLSVGLYAQEQITNIVGEGTSENYVFKEYSDKKYMLTFDKFDNITTYEMTEDSLHFIHSRKVDGAKEVILPKTTGKFVLFENTVASIAYNFVDDEIQYFEYGFGIERGYWDARHLENQVVLTHSFGINKGSNSYFVDLTNGIRDTLKNGFSILGLTEDFLFGRMFSADSISFNLISYHKWTKDYQQKMTFPQTTKRYHFINGLVIYDDLKKIFAYNIETGDHDLIYEHNKEFRSFTIYEIGNHIGLTFTNITNSEAELYDLKLIDLNDFNTQNLSISDAVSYIYHQQVHGKIIYQEKDKIFVHDLATDSRMNFNTNHNSLYHVAGDQYLVHLHYDTLKVVDILSEKELSHSVPITFKNSFFSIKSIKINDKYILNIYNSNEINKKLYQIDLTNQIVSNYEFEPYAPNGLTVMSNIVLNDSTILLFDKDLYLIKGKEFAKLNTAPMGEMRHLPYRITDGILYWIQDNGVYLDLYQYSESVVSKVGSIPKNILTISYPQNLIDFAIFLGDIYYIEGYNNANLYVIKKGSTVAKRIDNVDAPTSTYQLMIHKGNLYYAKGGTVRVILQDETIHNTFLSVDPASRFEKIILNNKMYYVNDKAIVHIDGKDFSIITEMEIRGGLNFPIKKINDSHILILRSDKTYDIFDGITIKKTELPDNVTFDLRFSEKYVLTYKLESNGEYKSYLYDYHQNVGITLPDNLSAMLLLKIFTYFGKNIIIAQHGSFPYARLMMYEMSDDFQTFQEIKSFDVLGWNTKVTFNQYQNEGLLYVGDRIFLMDENLDLTELNEIQGDAKQNNVIVNDGHFYFIAIHPDNGRQLFRIQPFSLRTSVDDGATIFTKVNIHPNPASQEIFYEGESFQTAEIYNFNGLLVQKSTIGDSNRLEINGLNNGVYVVILTSSSGAKSVGKFIKVE